MVELGTGVGSWFVEDGLHGVSRGREGVDIANDDLESDKDDDVGEEPTVVLDFRGVERTGVVVGEVFMIYNDSPHVCVIKEANLVYQDSENTKKSVPFINASFTVKQDLRVKTTSS